MAETTYNVGIYCRLSNDDEREGESASIENQKLLLQRYVRERGWNEIDVYVDDGYSGTNFQRPGVQRLIADAKAGRINVILVKDLSRFGRNYIEFGQYTDYLFPSIGCRFIALNNGIDTMSKDGSTDVMCFLNLFNEFYSRDTSKKVRAVRKACAESGKYMGPRPSFGYRRDPANKHHLIIDEDAAPVVRRIFAMRASGMTFRAIAVTLNQEGVPSPGTYFYQREGRSDPRHVNHLWSDSTVKGMIENEVYIGDMVQGRFGTLSYKSRKHIVRPEDEWIRVVGTHEPLISREVWDTVVSVGEKKVRKSPAIKTAGSIFSGILFCAGCGWKMRYHSERRKYTDGREAVIKSFICGNYARSGRTACTIHSIRESALAEIVLHDIREKALCAVHDREALISQIVRMKEKERSSQAASYEQELKVTAARVRELERLMQTLYEDKCTGVIPQPVFQTLMSKYEMERAQKTAALPELEQKVRTQLEARHDANHWSELIQRYTEISELDETILFALVDRIEVGETKKISSVRVCDVKVFYRYVGNVDDGYSGGNFQRPAFLEMLEDARKGVINLILVKDLSRLGRDFVEVGRYTDIVFPSLGCRFVSVLDCLDSESDNTDMLHFRSLMNDYHLRDLSSKIKSVILSKKASGQYLGPFAPYGYRKSAGDKHKLVVDEYAAGIVRRIFDMRLSGMSYIGIAAALNNEGIPSPRFYWYQSNGKDTSKANRFWMTAIVKVILRNEAYCGILRMNYRETRSYKDHTMTGKPESEWIRHEGLHEAIVPVDVWNAVQEINEDTRRRFENRQAPQQKLFSRKLICADCKSPLACIASKHRLKNGCEHQYISYVCSLHSHSGKVACSWHRVNENALAQIVIAEIQTHAQKVALDEEAVVDRLRHRMAAYDAQRLTHARQEIRQLRLRITKLEEVIAKLYEDKISGAVSENTALILMQKNEQERLSKAERLQTLLAEVEQTEKETSAIQNWTVLIRKYLNLQELDRTVLDELIDHIEIGERTVKDGKMQQDVKVFYRFVGQIN